MSSDLLQNSDRCYTGSSSVTEPVSTLESRTLLIHGSHGVLIW